MAVQKLTQKRVSEAVRAGVPTELRDAAARGLVLRVRSPTAWHWTVRRHLFGRNHRLDLGSDWTLDEARELALEVDRRVKARCDPFWHSQDAWREFYRVERLKKLNIDPSTVAAEPPPAPDAGPPRPEGPCEEWCAARDRWLAHVAARRREATAESYRKSLRIAEMRPFEGRWVSTVTVEEVAEAVEAIHARGAEVQARATTIAVRLFFKWMGSAGQRGRTGVAQFALKDLEAPEMTNRAMKEKASNRSAARVPNAHEIGTIVRVLRDDGSRLSERDRLAGLLALYSVQRRRAVASAERCQFEACGALGGIWRMPPSHRKTAEERTRRGLDVGDHVVPLPPPAWAVVRRAMAISESPYLFPATRERRAGKAVTHMAPDTVTHAFGQVPGNACSPHDMRRGFATTYAKEAGVNEKATATILDHNEGVEASVTNRHYRLFLDGEHEKWPLMNGWAAFIERCAGLRD